MIYRNEKQKKFFSTGGLENGNFLVYNFSSDEDWLVVKAEGGRFVAFEVGRVKVYDAYH